MEKIIDYLMALMPTMLGLLVFITAPSCNKILAAIFATELSLVTLFIVYYFLLKGGR